jgi:RNA polymerase sigma factor (TIGR02999 family)
LEITQLIRLVTDGDRAALDLLFPLLYDDLHRIARAYFMNERSENTLQPTAVVHEAYLKLIHQHSMRLQNRSHFLALSAVMMRRVLVEHARSKRRKKRGGKNVPVEFNDDMLGMTIDIDQMLDLEGALEKLETLDPRQVRLVELRFFGGLSTQDAAKVLDISVRTAENDWHMARAWLKRELGERP